MFTGDLTTEQGQQEYENYIMNNVRNEINSYTRQTQISVNADSGAAPVGVVLPFAGGPGVTTPVGTGIIIPTGWLLCDGRDVSRNVYSTLFTTIGTQYGVGDGSTTFNIPDMRGNVPVGVKTTQTSNPDISVLGVVAGSYTYSLAITNLPSHDHTMAHTHSLSSHTHSGTTANENETHIHTFSMQSRSTYALTGTGQGFYPGGSFSTVGPNVAHTHNFSTGGPSLNTTGVSSAANTGFTGGAMAVSLVQPSLPLNYIIKT